MEPAGWNRFDVGSPVINCPYGGLEGQPPRRIGGDGDGGKFLCMEGILSEPGCIVYSLGSNGQYQFEQAMLEARRGCPALGCTWVQLGSVRAIALHRAASSPAVSLPSSNTQRASTCVHVQSTVCKVYTFDCTYDGVSLDGNQRHFYHKLW